MRGNGTTSCVPGQQNRVPGEWETIDGCPDTSSARGMGGVGEAISVLQEAGSLFSSQRRKIRVK